MSSNITTTSGQKMSLSAAFSTPQFKEAIHNALNDAGQEKTFVASVIAASTANPVIQECTPKSVLSAALVGESLKLCPSPQLGHYYFVPYETVVKDRNGHNVPLLDAEGRQLMDNRGKPRYLTQKTAQFQMGYKGYIQLALRSAQYKNIVVLSIKEGELKRWNPLTEELVVELIEDDDVREQTPTVGYYAAFEYLNGFRKALYWGRTKMERHALRYSKGYAAKKGYTFWEKDFDGMAYKTMLRQLISKWGIMSTEMQMAFENDVDVIQDDAGNNAFPGAEPEPEQPIPPAYEESPETVVDDGNSSGEDGQVSLDEL